MRYKKTSLFFLSLLFIGGSTCYVRGDFVSSPAKLSQDTTLMDVVVPISMPISVDNVGDVVTATNLKIQNNSYGPIKIESMTIGGKNGWSISNFDKDYSNERVGLKELGLKVNGVKVTEGGGNVLNSAIKIGGNGANYTLDYDANVAYQKDSVSLTNVSDVVMIIDWDAVAGYVVAQDSDFRLVSSSPVKKYKYIGDDEYVIVPDIIHGEVNTNMEDMFRGNTKLKGVKYPDNITDMSSAFMGCTSLVEVPDNLPSNATVLYKTFSDCTSLVNGPKRIGGNVRNISYMFDGCTSLVNAPIISDSAYMMEKAFRNCKSLERTPDITSVDPGDFGFKMGSMFEGCTSLKTVGALPTTIDSISDLSSAFKGCTSLESIDFSPMDSVGRLSNTFEGCTSLKSVGMPKSFVSVFDGTFKDCVNLEGTLKIPKIASMTASIFDGTAKNIRLEYSGNYNIIDPLVFPSNITKVKK